MIENLFFEISNLACENGIAALREAGGNDTWKRSLRSAATTGRRCPPDWGAKLMGLRTFAKSRRWPGAALPPRGTHVR